MVLFRKKYSNTRDAGNPKAEAAAWYIFSRCMAFQLGWSDFMERQARRLPRQAGITVFLLSVCGSLGLSTYLIVSSLHSTPSPKDTFNHMSPQPVHTNKRRQAVAVVTSRDLERVTHFTRYMDSLARSPSGKTAFDSIMLSRPGLLDSARNTIQLYHHN